MKLTLILAVVIIAAGCTTGEKPQTAQTPIVGTWRLVSGTIIKNGDTTVTDYMNGRSFIKIINDTHFSFLGHDTNGGKDSTAMYSSGGGAYTLVDDTYTEHLQYCTDRQWEGHDFSFKVTVKNDTLIQQGMEEIADAGISQLNIEKYFRVR